MSDERILEIVKPYLNSNKEMLYSDFNRIFGSLETKNFSESCRNMMKALCH